MLGLYGSHPTVGKRHSGAIFYVPVQELVEGFPNGLSVTGQPAKLLTAIYDAARHRASFLEVLALMAPAHPAALVIDNSVREEHAIVAPLLKLKYVVRANGSEC
jgi:hypothetical protein